MHMRDNLWYLFVCVCVCVCDCVSAVYKARKQFVLQLEKYENNYKKLFGEVGMGVPKSKEQG